MGFDQAGISIIAKAMDVGNNLPCRAYIICIDGQ
jgi:hypothetical protein